MMAIRMDPGFLGMEFPSVLMHPDVLKPLMLEKAGFIPVSGEFEIPVITGFKADMTIPRQITFVTFNIFNEPWELGGVVFAEDHHPNWSDPIHARGGLEVVLADPSLLDPDMTVEEFYDGLIAAGALIGTLRLARKWTSLTGSSSRPA